MWKRVFYISLKNHRNIFDKTRYQRGNFLGLRSGGSIRGSQALTRLQTTDILSDMILPQEMRSLSSRKTIIRRRFDKTHRATSPERRRERHSTVFYESFLYQLFQNRTQRPGKFKEAVICKVIIVNRRLRVCQYIVGIEIMQILVANRQTVVDSTQTSIFLANGSIGLAVEAHYGEPRTLDQ